MILSKRVALGGVELDELDDSIVIRSVDPGVPHESTGTENRAGGFGSRLTMQHWDSLDVTVAFAIILHAISRDWLPFSPWLPTAQKCLILLFMGWLMHVCCREVTRRPRAAWRE